MIEAIALILSGLLAYFRLCGYKSQAFQAIAHIFVGSLFFACFALKSQTLAIILVSLSGIEVFAFFRDKYLCDESSQPPSPPSFA